MNGDGELLYDLLVAPRRALRRIAQNESLVQALLVAAGGCLLVLLLLSESGWMGGEQAAWNGGLLAGGCALGLVGWLLSTAVWHLTAELLGGTGRASALLAATGYAHLPLYFLLPLAAAAILRPQGAVIALALLGVVGVVAWKCWLDLLAVSVTYRLSCAKALLVLLMPWLTLAATWLLVILTVGLQLVWEG